MAYVNMVGGQDELVFDGDSMIVGADGTLLARAPQFVEHLLLHDLDLPAATADAATDGVASTSGAVDEMAPGSGAATGGTAHGGSTGDRRRLTGGRRCGSPG